MHLSVCVYVYSPAVHIGVVALFIPFLSLSDAILSLSKGLSALSVAGQLYSLWREGKNMFGYLHHCMFHSTLECRIMQKSRVRLLVTSTSMG